MREKTLTIGIMLILWIVAARWAASPLLPGPGVVGAALVKTVTEHNFWVHAGVSLRRVLLGISIGVVMGFVLGLSAGLSEAVDGVVHMVLSGFQSMPKAALLPLLIAWCGIGELSKISLVVMASFVPVTACLAAGLRYSPDGPVLAAMATGLSRGQVLWSIRIPLAMPQAFAGIRLAVGYAFLALATAELIAASSGLGYLVYEASYSLDLATALAIVAVIAGLNATAVVSVDGCERFAISWHARATR